MKEVLQAKFQIPELKAFLLETGEKTFDEANKYDKFYGNGLSLLDANIMNHKNGAVDTLWEIY